MNTNNLQIASQTSYPPFTLIIAFVLLAALIGLIYGVVLWRHPSGKVAFVVSSLILMFAVTVLGLVMLTVGSGSMG